MIDGLASPKIQLLIRNLKNDDDDSIGIS